MATHSRIRTNNTTANNPAAPAMNGNIEFECCVDSDAAITVGMTVGGVGGSKNTNSR
jgi:hypothetical protein